MPQLLPLKHQIHSQGKVQPFLLFLDTAFKYQDQTFHCRVNHKPCKVQTPLSSQVPWLIEKETASCPGTTRSKADINQSWIWHRNHQKSYLRAVYPKLQSNRQGRGRFKTQNICLKRERKYLISTLPYSQANKIGKHFINKLSTLIYGWAIYFNLSSYSKQGKSKVCSILNIKTGTNQMSSKCRMYLWWNIHSRNKKNFAMQKAGNENIKSHNFKPTRHVTKDPTHMHTHTALHAPLFRGK